MPAMMVGTLAVPPFPSPLEAPWSAPGLAWMTTVKTPGVGGGAVTSVVQFCTVPFVVGVIAEPVPGGPASGTAGS
jgi:hypothetical protein